MATPDSLDALVVIESRMKSAHQRVEAARKKADEANAKLKEAVIEAATLTKLFEDLGGAKALAPPAIARKAIPDFQAKALVALYLAGGRAGLNELLPILGRDSSQKDATRSTYHKMQGEYIHIPSPGIYELTELGRETAIELRNSGVLVKVITTEIPNKAIYDDYDIGDLGAPLDEQDDDNPLSPGD